MKRYLVVALLALVGLALVLLGPGPIKKGEAGPGSPTVLLCYWAQATSGPTDIVETLTDQWGSTVTDVRTPQSFCNPADKTLDRSSAAGDFVSATHLTCFSIRSNESDADESFQPRNVQESDQFGQLTLHIDEPNRLCVPSNKKGGLGATTQPSLVPFECYKVDLALGSFEKATFSVADQYTGQETQVKLREPALFCNSVEKSEADAVGNSTNGDTHMTCYRVTRFAFAPRTEYVTNQFGAYTMNILKPQMLCVSANKVD